MNPQEHQAHYNYMKYCQFPPTVPNGAQFIFPYPFQMQLSAISPYGVRPPYYFPNNPYVNPEPPMPKPQQQPEAIVISDDEDVPKKSMEKPSIIPPPPPPVQPQPRKQIKMLDLDQLESQGKLYDCESSESPQLPRRVSKPLNSKKTIRQIRYEQYQSPKLKKRQIKIRKETSRVLPKSVKYVQIGPEHQQLIYPQSSVKTRLIRVYMKNEEKFLRLYETLKQNSPNCNDEDVARILNITGKDYDRAMSLIQENGLSIQYFIETYQTKDQSDDEPTEKK